MLGLLLTGVDAALYMESEHFAAIVHRFPWDVVYQAGRSARGQDECFGLRRGHWPVRQSTDAVSRPTRFNLNMVKPSGGGSTLFACRMMSEKQFSQEWWHELAVPGRTDVFGLYRDLHFMRSSASQSHICHDSDQTVQKFDSNPTPPPNPAAKARRPFPESLAV